MTKRLPGIDESFPMVDELHEAVVPKWDASVLVVVCRTRTAEWVVGVDTVEASVHDRPLREHPQRSCWVDTCQDGRLLVYQRLYGQGRPVRGQGGTRDERLALVAKLRTTFDVPC